MKDRQGSLDLERLGALIAAAAVDVLRKALAPPAQAPGAEDGLPFGLSEAARAQKPPPAHPALGSAHPARRVDHGLVVKLARDGLHADEIAKRAGCSRSRVAQICGRAKVGIRRKPNVGGPARIDREAVRAGAAEGLSQRQIAERVGCTPGRVAQLCREMGVRTAGAGRQASSLGEADRERLLELRRGGMSVQKAADAVGTSYDVARRACRRAGLSGRRTEDDGAKAPGTAKLPMKERNAEIVRLRREGMRDRAIAERMGLTVGQVSGAVFKARQAGLLPKPAPDGRREAERPSANGRPRPNGEERPNGRRFDHDEAVELFKAGCETAEIADHYGVAQGAVVCLLKRRGETPLSERDRWIAQEVLRLRREGRTFSGIASELGIPLTTATTIHAHETSGQAKEAR